MRKFVAEKIYDEEAMRWKLFCYEKKLWWKTVSYKENSLQEKLNNKEKKPNCDKNLNMINSNKII